MTWRRYGKPRSLLTAQFVTTFLVCAEKQIKMLHRGPALCLESLFLTAESFIQIKNKLLGSWNYFFLYLEKTQHFWSNGHCKLKRFLNSKFCMAVLKHLAPKKASVPRKDMPASSVRFSYLFQSIQLEHWTMRSIGYSWGNRIVSRSDLSIALSSFSVMVDMRVCACFLL